MNSQTVVLHIDGLTKHYGKVQALTDLSLDVFQGEIFGYLGPNGAGKTTTIRTLLDLIRPTAGHATIFGMDVNKDSVKVHARIGNLPGELALWNHMTGWEIVEYLGGLRGGVDRNYVGELAERLDMDMTRKVKACSGTMAVSSSWSARRKPFQSTRNIWMSSNTGRHVNIFLQQTICQEFL